jgi:predicted dithiol-disulfide oxidoreductase (DUF899 family)
MTENQRNLPQVVSAAEWQGARQQLLVKEKEATRARDALAAKRRRLPMVKIEREYDFEGSRPGEASRRSAASGPSST